MLRDKKGITIITLIITVIVMGIILGITFTTVDNLLRETDTNKLKTNLYLIQARAETLLDDYLFDGTDNLGSTSLSESISKFGWQQNTIQYIYREWGIEELQKQGIDVSNVSPNETFIIRYDIINEEVDIASTRGIVDSEGIEKYTLSSLEEE